MKRDESRLPTFRRSPLFNMLLAAAASLSLLLQTSSAFDAFITMKNGYFYDPAAGKSWVPHGIAYQTWNRPLGVWQTPQQIDYDLDEMVKMGANSIRVDFVWKQIEEKGDNQFEWDNYDYLIQAAEKRNIRIFPLIGYQWPPDWFPDDWYTMHPPAYDSSGIYHPTRWQSDIIGYETPPARAQYAEWISNVCARYKDSKAIVGWIVGNESGYLGLWSGLLDGYDTNCEAAFRTWCQTKYVTVTNLNGAWTKSYTNFADISFIERYTEYGSDGAEWADMVQWREDSIAGFTALGAVAAKQADTNHLISYSTVGMQWGEEDWRYHAENRGKITATCLASNAPIDFFSVNNYPWSILGHESQNGRWGITFTKRVAKVPVMYSETGFTSSETMWPGMNEQREGPLVRNSLWESLETGAIGTHIFSWMDRPYITDREKGFGIVYADRNVKPAFWVSRDAYDLMDQAKINELLAASTDRKPDIAFLWTAANHSQYNRYECEMQQIHGALNRLGYEPTFIDINDLASGDYTNYRVIVLPRNMRVESQVPGTGKGVLRFLRENVMTKGIHILASADLPGLQNQNGLPQADATNELTQLFGIDAGDVGGFEVAPRTDNYIASNMVRIAVTFTNAIGALTNGYKVTPSVWKYNDEVRVTDGSVWARMDTGRNKGFEDSSTNFPGWYTWGESSMAIQHWFPMDGTNMLQMWSDAGVWQEFPAVQGGRYTASAYFLSNPGDCLRGGSAAKVVIEWRDMTNGLISTSESSVLQGSTTGSWVQFKVDAFAPSNTIVARRVIRYDSTTNYANLLANGSLSGTGAAPNAWSSWNDSNHAPDAGTYRSPGNAYAFWWDSGIFQAVTNVFHTGDTVQFGGYLLTPSWDVLRNGDKHGQIDLECWSGTNMVSTTTAAPTITSTSPTDTWILATGTVVVAAGVDRLQFVIRCAGAAGDGRFLADDMFLQDTTPGGSVFVDNWQTSPGLVVKDHGTAKSAIFLFSAGDMSPDGDGDGEMDVWPWRWRYDYFGAIIRDYFGVQPILQATGTNAYLCLAEYRTCTNGATLWQVKNYLYDRFAANGTGGDPQTFTITSSLLSNKTVHAFEAGRILATNCNGTINLTLVPDGQEILLAYPPTNSLVCQLTDAPAVIHPFGDKNYTITVNYDTLNQTNLTLMVALVGGAYTSAVYQVIATNVSGAGQQLVYMWIPDYNQSDTNYLSTPEGGNYQIVTWLADASSNAVTPQAVQNTQLDWGIRPTTNLPTVMNKGSTTNIPIEWQDLYEYLYWQHCPMARNDAFPSRVAVYRSTKTEKQFPGHFARVNQVCDWLESLGYQSANQQDVSFGSVIVTTTVSAASGGPVVMFSDSMETGTNGWTADGLWHQATDLYASSNHAWAYNNGINYSTGARNSGSLVTPWIQLSNGLNAKLTFKSWYETEDTGTAWDRKLVYLSTDGTNWTQLLQISGPNKQWTSQTFDLAPYAGQRIKIKFFFDSIDGVYNTFKGWYVDDVSVASTPTATLPVYSDSFEAGTNGWTADGLWHQATDLYASSNHSWAYNNSSTNYVTGTRNSGSLVSPWIDVTNGANATLAFRSWYETEDTGTAWDRKLVYVSTDGTNWNQILQISGPNKSWTQQTCDLSLYAGRRIKIRFFFDTIDAINNNFRGWYIDDVAVSVEAPVDNSFAAFSDSVEAGTNGWTAGGLWHIASDLAASPTHSWAYNNGTNYDTGARSTGALISPWIDLSSAASATLNFKSWYETEDTGTAWDRKLVYVSTDGTNWSQVLQVSGPNKQWTAQACDLGAYIGQKIQLRFYFDTIDPLYNNFRGWYVDDIRVSVVSSGVLFLDAFANGLTNWTRVAGAANWDVTNNALRAWRIGNNDNILSAGNMSWSNYSVQASILYNKQGPYFSDADLLLRYQDRYNYYKVGIRNFYGAWRLRYEVDEQGVVTSQGWLYLFSKTNQPVEGAWYNLKADVQGTNVNVFFNGDPAGSFVITNFLSGKIAIGTMAEQLGIWEPPQGYFFIDDDETGMTGSPLNMDWGYLQQFFNTVIFPSVFAMNDTEVANLLTWVNAGTYSLISMDGGLGMVDEGGTNKIGRTAGLFGVAPNLTTISGLNKATIGTNDHYVTLDYAPGAQITAAGTATAWSAPTNSSIVLGTLDNGTASVPALICSKIGSDPNSPTKAFCFNFAVDTQGQLTNAFHTIAQRVFEWTRGEAYKVLLQLKYPNPAGVNFDFVVAQVTGWVLDGNGTNNLIVNLPTDGIMTGDNLYWSMYVYPWDSTYPWGDHAGFYSSANDGFNVSIPGQGLEIFGGVDPAWGGRGWSLWAGYNTRGSNAVIEFGVKAQGSITNEDNFDDGNYTGWTISPSPNISWSVANGALRATVVGTGGYSYITRDGVNVSNQHITLEYDVRFTDAATNGGIVYRGAVMYVNPALCGWADLNPNYTNYAGLAIGAWHHVVINIRDGDPYWTSDLYVDAQPVFLSEPIEVTNFTSSSVGFLSPYYGGYTEWDNFRVADEQYSLVYQSVNGEVIPTNSDGTLFPYLPDYDPAWWEHEGSALGAQYEWYVYFRSGSMHAYTTTHVYFAPRLMVESPAFPTYMNPGDTVSVPIEWENLQSLPVNMQLHLEDPYVGTAYVNQIFMLTNSWGTNSFTVTIPTNLPAHSNYLWVAYTYPTNLTGTDAFNGRIGLDDTFRFTPDGKPFMPETRVTISSLSSGGDTFGVYSDAGIPLATQILTWQGGTASFNGDYLGETPPEGVKCFQTIGNYWQGWGVFAASAPADMSAFANGFLKFWVKNSVQLTLNIEDWDGAKTTVYIANSTNNWRQVTVPLTMLAGVNFSRIKGYFEITALSATTFYIDNVQWIKGVYHVYHDAGIPSGANISTWGDPNAAFNANFSGQSPPEGGKCFYTQTTNSAGWGVNFPTNTVDMHLYSNALLRFWAKSTEPLTIGIEGPPGTVVNRQIPSTGDAWYQFALPLTNFTGINFTQVRSLFNVTVTNAATFYIDDVRWECTTNLVVGPPALSLYSDAGIPTNTGVLVWWASQYWGQVSGPYNNGDFETAPQTNWTLSVSGGSATGQYVAAAAHNGSVGLRERNGTDTGSTWCITYQTLTAWAGDVFNGGAWIRQPAGNGWPAGSVAFAQLRFLDFGGVTITSYVSSVQVTNSGQGWTYCGTADVTAPPQARSLRLELVVQKPAGVSGESVADFDDAAVNQANSFNGDFADDPTTPEGIKCFRSYCVAWSGWGIFYTNGVTDLSAYTNGYLNFWYKSSGYTKVEIQSIQGGVTNTAQGAFFGPTTNQNGEIAWTYQSIPITNFVGVSLSNIKSPFMLTDPNYDRAFYVDDVKWVLGP